MRFSLLLLLAGAVPAILHGQEQTESPPPNASGVRILGQLADGTVPLPASPVPKLAFAPEDILKSKTVETGDRRITLQQVVPVELPSVPEPVPPPDPSSPNTQAQLQESGGTELLLIGATIYHSAAFTDGPRTLVQVWNQESKQTFTCWSSANWNWLGGIGGFQGADGQRYALLMGHGNVDIDQWNERLAQQGREYEAPVIPAIPAGDATFVVTEGAPTAQDLAALAALHTLYNTESERLEAAYEGRERARLEREEYLRNNPEQPKNIIIRHWRMDAAGQEGITPKPAVSQ